MRVDPILLKRLGRAAACALAGAAIITTATSVHDREPAASDVPAPQAVDPLSAELARCRQIAQPKDVDDACRTAWAEVRQRFFAIHDGATP
jgi:conjugative transfer region protein TrbK